MKNQFLGPSLVAGGNTSLDPLFLFSHFFFSRFFVFFLAFFSFFPKKKFLVFFFLLFLSNIFFAGVSIRVQLFPP